MTKKVCEQRKKAAKKHPHHAKFRRNKTIKHLPKQPAQKDRDERWKQQLAVFAVSSDFITIGSNDALMVFERCLSDV